MMTSDFNNLKSLAYTDERLLQIIPKQTFTLPILYESYDRFVASLNKRGATLDKDKDTGDYNSIYRKDAKGRLKIMKNMDKEMEKLITYCSKVAVITRLVVAALKKYSYIEPEELGKVYSRTNPSEQPYRNSYATTDIIKVLEELTKKPQWAGVNIAAFVLAYYLTHDYDESNDKMYRLAGGFENETFKSRLTTLRMKLRTENRKSKTAKDNNNNNLVYYFDFEIPTVIAYADWYFQQPAS